MKLIIDMDEALISTGIFSDRIAAVAVICRVNIGAQKRALNALGDAGQFQTACEIGRASPPRAGTVSISPYSSSQAVIALGSRLSFAWRGGVTWSIVAPLATVAVTPLLVSRSWTDRLPSKLLQRSFAGLCMEGSSSS